MATYYGTWKQINSANAYRVVLSLTENINFSTGSVVGFDYDLQVETANGFGFSDWTVGYYLKIGNTVVLNKPYKSTDPQTSVGTNITTSIAKGTGVTVQRTAISLPIEAYIETSTQAYYLPGKITLSGAFTIGWTVAGGATVNSIVDNGDNTITIVTTMGLDGTNNEVSNVHLYGFVNKTTGTPSVFDYDFFAIGDEAYGTISGRTVTFRIPISSMKNPPTSSPYTVRVRAYSISKWGDNPGGECLNSGELFIRKAIEVYGNSNTFKVGELYTSPNKDGEFKPVEHIYYNDTTNNKWIKIQ